MGIRFLQACRNCHRRITETLCRIFTPNDGGSNPPGGTLFERYILEPIRFWKGHGEPYSCFSNFSSDPVIWNGFHFKTSEHLYQMFKVAKQEDKQRVMDALTAKEAKTIANSCERVLSWDVVKLDFMVDTLQYKVHSNPHIRELLLSTGNTEIIEASPYDGFWGSGKDGNGLNKLGKAWMLVRAQCRYYGTP